MFWNINNRTERRAMMQQMGAFGHELINPSNSASFAENRFYWVVALEDCIVSYTDLDTKSNNVGTKTNVALEKGDWISGPVQNFSISQGLVRAYNQEDSRQVDTSFP